MKAKAAKPAPHQVAVEVKGLERQAMEMFLMFDTPLIVHAWSLKLRQEMLQKHMQQITVREAKDPYEHFLRSIYRMDDGTYGFPVVGIKESMATAATDLEGIAKAQIYRNIFCTGRRGYQIAAFADLRTPQELATLYSPNAPSIREDMVRLSGIARTPDIRYRAEFWPCALRFNLLYFSDFISHESIFNLVHHGGARIGLGEWRQEKGGNNGAFHVANEEEKKQIERWIKAGQKEPEPIDVQGWLRSITPEKKDIGEPRVDRAARYAEEQGAKKSTAKRKTNGTGAHR